MRRLAITVATFLGLAVLHSACDGEATSVEESDNQLNAGVGTPLPAIDRGGSVTEFHGNPTRDGLYSAPTLTPAALGTLHRDTSFEGIVTGAVYAQPLWVANGPGGREAFVVATEENHVTVLGGNGAVVWDKTYGPPATSNLPCGNIRPLGITGTPVIDEASRTIYFDTMTTPDQNRTFQHLIYAVSLDTGETKTGWPIDFKNIVPGVSAAHHNQRGALTLVNGMLYIPYGGHFGDCDPYRGTVVGVPVNNPAQAKHWATPAKEGGIWATGGVASDGASIFAATGNTEGASSWAGGEAVLRLRPGPSFSSQPVDFFAPTNWKELDNGDVDLGGANPVLFDMPGAPVPHLVLAFGKDANLYIGNRDNLGGVGGALSVTRVTSGAMLGASAAYTTSRGAYVAMRAAYGNGVGCPNGERGNIAVAKITPENPPRAQIVWCTKEKLGSPMATKDANGKVILWDANDRLWAYDGETGAKLFEGGGETDGLGSAMQYFNSPIAAGGRIAVATKGRLVVFKP